MDEHVPHESAKDLNWNLVGTAKPIALATDQATLAVLMDIRRELKKLNAVFACPNAQRIPFVLDQIQKNTRKPAKKKRKKKI